eukprot:m.309967 g.309967  ORF g.309967 m.309967 type:complete len:244 (+) comp24090_c0_seq1:41-772(+)
MLVALRTVLLAAVVSSGVASLSTSRCPGLEESSLLVESWNRNDGSHVAQTSGSWVESDLHASSTHGLVRVTRLGLRMHKSSWVERPIDLSSVAITRWEVDFRLRNVQSSDRLVFKISYDGGATFEVLGIYTKAQGNVEDRMSFDIDEATVLRIETVGFTKVNGKSSHAFITASSLQACGDRDSGRVRFADHLGDDTESMPLVGHPGLNDPVHDNREVNDEGLDNSTEESLMDDTQPMMAFATT